jgi:hypothetical protein
MRLTTAQRNRLPSSSFAIPSERKYPINDAAHVRDAASRLEAQRNAGHISDSMYRSARARIARAERHFGVDGWYSANPAKQSIAVDSNTRLLVVGTALVGTAVAIAAILVAGKASATTTTTTTTTGQAVALDQSNAGTLEAVSVGDSVTITLEASASEGTAWPAATVTPSGVLGPPTRSTSATGISDTYPVIAAGSVTVSYLETTPNGISMPTVFNITAANAAPAADIVMQQPEAIQSVALTISDAGHQTSVSVGSTLSITLGSSAATQWEMPTVNGAVLSAPTRTSTATSITDTFRVLAPGNANVAYTAHPHATQKTFNIVAS